MFTLQDFDLDYYHDVVVVVVVVVALGFNAGVKEDIKEDRESAEELCIQRTQE